MRRIGALCAILALGACQSENVDGGNATAANFTLESNEGAPTEQRESNEATVADRAGNAVQRPAADPAQPADPGRETQEPAPDLPIDKGVYVEPGVGCGNPPNASWRIWNGEGLSGSSTHSCHASPVIQKGRDITVEQTCTDNQSGKPSSRTVVLRIRDRRHFSQLNDGGSDQSFRWCAPNDVPQWLREART